ncbi:D-alanine--D-alanine ligase [Diplogelasinospora grovesii]|uniref:D-alanine--D-alanine ligase n=1 Tax=Diplogelasinospora grovesii TaxID=303347 RepID=A0AAN6NF97_9PEZI|nr:D-alanine--D-alanine ligase [Diplogelasinospora grovesii]
MASSPSSSCSGSSKTTSSEKVHVAVLFGGRSTEQKTSLQLAKDVIEALDRKRYHVAPIFVTPQGQWVLCPFMDDTIIVPSGDDGVQVALLPGGRGRWVAVKPNIRLSDFTLHILFPWSADILRSTAALDKTIARHSLKAAGLQVPRSIKLTGNDERTNPGVAFADAVDAGIDSLPVFIKPARSRSSAGSSKVSTWDDLAPALSKGYQYDRKLLAEEAIQGRHIQIGVLEDAKGQLMISRPGEVITAESRHLYTNGGNTHVGGNETVLEVPADMPKEVGARMKDAAAKAFRALDCNAMARVDFVLTEDMSFRVNELDIIPDFTKTSMFAKVMGASGVKYPEMIEQMIANGLARARGGWDTGMTQSQQEQT